MSDGNTMDGFDWARHEERIAGLNGVIDIGIGKFAVAETGLEMTELGELFQGLYHQLIDGGANVTNLTCPKGIIAVYVRRRGKSLDVGTRRDWEQLGWSNLCDLLDADARKQRGNQ